VLPVLNEKVVDLAIRFGLGIDAYIDQASVFARKNYFYPDSPKGYQISQMDNPIVGLGHIDIQLEDGTTKRIGVTRAHLEEDAGKSVHDQFEG
ncbi:Asp-tRNA(Asn)/Glu-tRNA(Gln) amidotransferase GatCAB subunit B, partial [Klebsiella pneumoniae]|nr:Asp-tRNA(Asn)/Glu-tRNA(Gln) amidotransferase GatCAB subunit B [Klebsiella pneumoniae]